ncbi:PEP-CTERM sorting domain-containing protein [Permianibacter sp. IMCC34836]|uniref:PEP-CTERM sorting domain-containing protein n=1 Tax=Permianibacter fluminis TaxID=2738515 RepID=UPI001555211A|nr:PEP-CTERM sorting domain-containing protein [Permianibacter fluminis]NQD35721.1 PEP-CTERM sorting domain-containing protein [Permianibacter fluminis]
MKQTHHGLPRFLLAVALVLSATVALPAKADLIVPGSTYSLNLLSDSGNSSADPITFDGLWESFTRTTNDGNQIGLRINETQWDLGGGLHALEVIIMADGDIYPILGETGYVNIGPDVLDVIGNVSVQSAVLSMFIDSVLLVDGDMFNYFPSYFSDPWDGGFFNGGGVGWSNLGGRGVDEIHILITVQDIRVPEPATMLLLSLGLLAMVGRQRKLRAI